jgi:hypothetical protein
MRIDVEISVTKGALHQLELGAIEQYGSQHVAFRVKATR